MREPGTLPKIITIDGIDGIGKATASKLLKARLEAKGYKVGAIAPPFYETNTGKDIKDYLMNGYGDISDRRVCSAMYGQDRNMFYRQHFNEYFGVNSEYDIVMYDRSWLSNLFYQTTLGLQHHDDIRNFVHHTPGGTPDFALYETCLTRYKDFTSDADMIPKCQSLTLGEMRDGLEHWVMPKLVERIALKALYTDQRVMMVRDHIQFIYNLEILPWIGMRNMGPDDKYRKICDIPFTAATPICNLVLVPSLKDGGLQFIKNNLMKRYAGNKELLDRNESSMSYLEEVVENIMWIHEHWDFIRGVKPVPLSGKSMVGTEFDTTRIGDPGIEVDDIVRDRILQGSTTLYDANSINRYMSRTFTYTPIVVTHKDMEHMKQYNPEYIVDTLIAQELMKIDIHI